jgi:hypothetical protein
MNGLKNVLYTDNGSLFSHKWNKKLIPATTWITPEIGGENK